MMCGERRSFTTIAKNYFEPAGKAIEVARVEVPARNFDERVRVRSHRFGVRVWESLGGGRWRVMC